MKQVDADGFAATSKLVNASKMLKEEEQKLLKRLKKIRSIKSKIKETLIKEL